MFDRRYDLLYKSANYLYLIRVFNTEMSSYSIFLNLLREKKRALKILRTTNWKTEMGTGTQSQGDRVENGLTFD